MVVAELIKDKDYPYIAWKIRMPEKMGLGDEFFGACKSKDGLLIPLDGDTIYCAKDEVLDYKVWNDDEGRECLTVVVPYEEE